MTWLVVIVSICFSFDFTHASLLPEFDKRCNFMDVCHAEVSPHKYYDQERYFDKTVPSRVHQIWFGDASKKPETTSNWIKFSENFKYEYTLWTEDSLKEAAKFVSPVNMRYINMFIKKKNYWAASDILRFEILCHLGGIYVDCDISPPIFEGRDIDIREIASMKGLTVVTEHNSRNIGESALFVMNGYVMAAPKHPVIVSLVEQIEKNIKSWESKKKNHDAMFCTGPFFFNKVLFGNFNLIPITYFKYFGMY